MLSILEFQEKLLSTFDVASIDSIRAKSLERRTDSKFVTEKESLIRLLPLLKDSYSVLKAGDKYCATYKTQYFDTEDFSFFNDHKNGRRIRYKIRIREYCDRQLCFMEIKKRRSDIEQNKIRVQHELNKFGLNDKEKSLIQRYTNRDYKLIPTAFIACKRVNLINQTLNERVTIDTALEIILSDKKIGFKDIAILEVKQWPFKRHSLIMDSLKKLHIQQRKISKYCSAIALAQPNITFNRLIPRINFLKDYIS